MKYKNIIIVVAIVILFGGLAIYAKPGKTDNKEIQGTEITDGNNFHPAVNGEDTSNNEDAFLTASETFYDFGSIQMKNGNVNRMFDITNNTSEDILIERVTTSCMCTVAYIIDGENKKGPFGMPGHGGPVPKPNYTIKAGETIQIEAVFDPNAHGPAGVGLIERVVRLEYTNGKIIDLTFKAIVTP